MEEIKVGQTLYRVRNNTIESVKVKKVGRKYFYLETGWSKDYPVDKQTLKYEDKTYSHNNFQLYKSPQEIQNKQERDNLLDELRDYFSWSGNYKNLSLEQLRQITQIIQL